MPFQKNCSHLAEDYENNLIIYTNFRLDANLFFFDLVRRQDVGLNRKVFNLRCLLRDYFFLTQASLSVVILFLTDKECQYLKSKLP